MKKVRIRVREIDPLICPLCRLPWEFHPRLEDTDEPYCRTFTIQDAEPTSTIPPKGGNPVRDPSTRGRPFFFQIR